MRKAIFIDRDGTLNEDFGYVYQEKYWTWMDGAISGLKSLQRMGYDLFIITNQSGIARGYYSEQDFLTLRDWVHAELKSMDIHICETLYCPHHPDIDGKCDCRKPSPGMLLEAAEKHEIDLANSWMVGDAVRDVQAGVKAGCNAALVNHHFPEENRLPEGVAWYSTLAHFAKSLA